MNTTTVGSGIIVTATPSIPGFSLFGQGLSAIPQIPELSLPTFFSALGDGPDAEEALEDAGESDFNVERRVDENGDQISPGIVVRGANQRELSTVLQAIEAGALSDLLGPVFDRINDADVKIIVNFDVSERDLTDAYGGIQYEVDGTDTSKLVQGSEIIVDISRTVRNQRDLEDTIAHEFGHLMLENGRFATTFNESESRAQEYENEIEDELFDGFEPISFLEAPDIVATINGGTQIYGPNAVAQGTDGNNFIITPPGLTNDNIDAGDGNDLIFSGIGTDYIKVGDEGTNLIVSTHAQTTGWVGLASTASIDTNVAAEDLEFTLIGSDLIITYGSGLDPLVDPNKTIISDWVGSNFVFVSTNQGIVHRDFYILQNLSEHSQFQNSSSQNSSAFSFEDSDVFLFDALENDSQTSAELAVPFHTVFNEAISSANSLPDNPPPLRLDNEPNDIRAQWHLGFEEYHLL